MNSIHGDIHLSDSAATELTVAPLSFAQERLWFLEQFEPDAVLYNIPLGLRIKGNLDIGIFTKAMREVVKRHEILRTVFRDEEEGIQQVVLADMKIPVTIMDYRSLPKEEKEEKAQLAVEREAVTRFDLTAGPLVRIMLIHLSDDEYICLLTMHHIVSDGWSMGVLVNEFATLYSAFLENHESPLSPLSYQYAAFAGRQQEDMRSGRMDESINYWRQKLEGFSPVSLLPASGLANTASHHDADVVHSSLSHPLSESLVKLSSRLQASPYMTLLAAFSVVFSRYADSDDIVLGSLIANRNRAELEPLIGFFVNTLPLRLDLSGSPTFEELIGRVRDVTLEAYIHQEIPFEKIVEVAQPDRSTDAMPLVQVMVIMQNAPMAELSLQGLTVTSYPVGARTVRFDVEVYLWEADGEIQCDIVYKKALLSRAAVERLMGHLVTVLTTCVAESDIEVTRLSLLSDDEQDFLCRSGRGNLYPIPQKCVHELFAEQARKTPDYPAAVDVGGRTSTYRELATDADRIAEHLRENGMRKQDRVGICMGHSTELLAVVLGILKAGGIYVPLDPAWPSQRTAFVVDDCRMICVIVDAKREEDLRKSLSDRKNNSRNVNIIRADTMLAAHQRKSTGKGTTDLDPSDGAYIIYTSGSTGEPKGVFLEHRNVVNYITWALRQYGNNQPVNFPLFSPLAFDLTVTSIFVPLISGGTVRIYDDDNSTPVILQVITDDQVDVVKLTPAHLALALANGFSPKRISSLILGGEDLKVDLARTVHDQTNGRVKIYNEYGPTEATVGCMIHQFDPELEIAGSVSIGGPIDNSVICIVDTNLNPVPVGVVGELSIGGAGVARGYIGRDELTAERFIPHADQHDMRMYRTGDRARWEEDGNITYLGRVDRQVKIRGYRIEPGEIEAVLLDHPDVQSAAVVCREVRDSLSDQQNLQYCSQCGMPSNYRGISFDQNGVCTLCTEFNTYEEQAMQYFRTPDDLRLDMKKTTGPYDCLVLYSGGKDSSYMLCKLVEMGYRILLFTLDNGYLYESAKQNIKSAVAHFDVDYQIHTPESMTGILSESLKVHSNVCNGCFKSIYTAAIQTALDKQIPHIVTGLSRGQLFETRLGDLFGSGVFEPEEIDAAVLVARKAYHRMDDTILRTMAGDLFATDEVFEKIQFIDFYRYCDVTRADILSYLQKHMVWVSPDEIGCSTNCAVNDAGIFVHHRERGFHNYALPGSWEVRIGHRTREDFLAELAVSPDMDRTHNILQELGYSFQYEETTYGSLAAFFTADRDLDETELQDHLNLHLPSYMIPAYFSQVQTLPLTINGKVDYEQLSQHHLTAKKLKTDPSPPKTSTEKELASIWCEVLKAECNDINTDFFEIGGHSLAATRVAVRIKRQFGIDIALKSLFEQRTIKGLALAVDSATVDMYGDEQFNELLAEIEGMSEDEIIK